MFVPIAADLDALRMIWESKRSALFETGDQVDRGARGEIVALLDAGQ